MLSDDSWKSYVSTGCNPDPNTYSERFSPEAPPISRDAPIRGLLNNKQERIEQLLLVISNLNLDRDSVRAACKR